MGGRAADGADLHAAGGVSARSPRISSGPLADRRFPARHRADLRTVGAFVAEHSWQPATRRLRSRLPVECLLPAGTSGFMARPAERSRQRRDRAGRALAWWRTSSSAAGADRARSGGPPQRSRHRCVLLPVLIVFVISSLVLATSDPLRETATVALMLALLLFPLGFALPLLQADLSAAGTLRQLLTDVATDPAPRPWRNRLATALDDPDLRYGYWHAGTQRYAGPDGTDAADGPPADSRQWIPVEHAGQPSSSIAVDPSIELWPELEQAVADATALAITTESSRDERTELAAARRPGRRERTRAHGARSAGGHAAAACRHAHPAHPCQRRRRPTASMGWPKLDAISTSQSRSCAT